MMRIVRNVRKWETFENALYCMRKRKNGRGTCEMRFVTRRLTIVGIVIKMLVLYIFSLRRNFFFIHNFFL